MPTANLNPAYDTKICLGLNYRNLLERPDEHYDSSHPEIKSKTKESVFPKRQEGTQEQKNRVVWVLLLECLPFSFSATL